MILGQEDLDGRLIVLGEVICQGLGAERFVQEKLRPYLKQNFPDAQLTSRLTRPRRRRPRPTSAPWSTC
jgi:hypothetical protein